MPVLNVVLAPLLACAAAAADITADPPPGWTVSADKPSGDIVLVLKGPETSSFVLTRLKALDLNNRAVVRSLLVDVLAGINDKSGLKFAPASEIQSFTYDNGLTAQVLRVNLDDKPRLALAVTDFGGAPMLGTLTSAVPDMMLPAILGGLHASGNVPAPPSISLDEQLQFSLPKGFSARALTEREQSLGFVLAIDGLGSELMVQKLVDDSTPVSEQPQILKGTAASMAGASPQSVGPVTLIRTPPGTDFIYVTAKAQDASGPTQVAAAYLPWGYLGYSVLAKGPNAGQLVVDTFSTLSLGSSALPKVIAETPRIPLPTSLPGGSPQLWAAGVGLGAFLLALAVWKGRRRL